MTRSFALPIACCIAMLALAYVAAPVFAQESGRTSPRGAVPEDAPPAGGIVDGDFAEPDGFRVDVCIMQSEFAMSLISGEYRSALTGTLDFRFDNSIKVERNENEAPIVLAAADLQLVTPMTYGPQAKVSALRLHAKVIAYGAYNVESGAMWVQAYFVSQQGRLPVPMPIMLVGGVSDGYLHLASESDMSDAGVELRIAGAVEDAGWTIEGEDRVAADGTAAIPTDGRPICRPFIETDGD